MRGREICLRGSSIMTIAAGHVVASKGPVPPITPVPDDNAVDAQMTYLADTAVKRVAERAVARGLRAPVQLVHNDYTEKSGPQRVRDLLGAVEAEARLQRRFAEYNVWRPISSGPVRTMPLALADASSIARGDLVTADLVYSDRTGAIYHGLYNPAHRWFYFPEMARDEAVLIKCYDSLKDGRARFSLHSAFDDPTPPADAPSRESIEVHSFAFF